MIFKNIVVAIVLCCCSFGLCAQNSWTNAGANLLFHAGPVAIGSSDLASQTEGYLLSVDGQIAVEETLIQLSDNWADYVFASNYPLLPLDDLPSFIAQNGHLPNMPPAKEVQEDGLSLSKATGLLLEKIEELSLYLIEDARQDKRLEEKIQALSSNK